MPKGLEVLLGCHKARGGWRGWQAASATTQAQKDKHCVFSLFVDASSEAVDVNI